MPTNTCKDCKGTGLYVGLTVKEPCATCGGEYNPNAGLTISGLTPGARYTVTWGFDLCTVDELLAPEPDLKIVSIEFY